MSIFVIGPQRIILTGVLPIDNKAILVQVMACRWTGDKPLSEPMLTQFIDIYAALGVDELSRMFYMSWTLHRWMMFFRYIIYICPFTFHIFLIRFAMATTSDICFYSQQRTCQMSRPMWLIFFHGHQRFQVWQQQLAPIALTTFWWNSGFDRNCFCYSSRRTALFNTRFCYYQDNIAVLVCAKFCVDQTGMR